MRRTVLLPESLFMISVRPLLVSMSQFCVILFAEWSTEFDLGNKTCSSKVRSRFSYTYTNQLCLLRI